MSDAANPLDLISRSDRQRLEKFAAEVRIDVGSAVAALVELELRCFRENGVTLCGLSAGQVARRAVRIGRERGGGA